MIRLNQAVIVEGKYDKITLENVIDALIIPTNGFGIFKDREKCGLIRTLSQRDGVIVMTDSDSAGMMIRSYLKKICGSGKIINVYVPQLAGREKRKQKSGKEGLLGVEGMTQEVLLTALRQSGVSGDIASAPEKKVTKAELFTLGLSGGENSAVLRKELLHFLNLPENMSANAFLDLVNTLYGSEKFERLVLQWRQGADKR